jgi:hypothetical protein
MIERTKGYVQLVAACILHKSDRTTRGAEMPLRVTRTLPRLRRAGKLNCPHARTWRKRRTRSHAHGDTACNGTSKPAVAFRPRGSARRRRRIRRFVQAGRSVCSLCPCCLPASVLRCHQVA